MSSGHERSREPRTLLQPAPLDDVSTALDADSDALLERHVRMLEWHA